MTLAAAQGYIADICDAQMKNTETVFGAACKRFTNHSKQQSCEWVE